MISSITHHQTECQQFFRDYIPSTANVLFIGTLGFNSVCLYFPTLLAEYNNVEFVFFVEKRPTVSPVLQQIADQNKAALEALLGGRIRFTDIDIVAEDSAVVAGRNAAKMCAELLCNPYSDVIVDASAMSRGICFTVTRQIFETACNGAFHAHVVVADKKSSIQVTSESSDTPEFMHGFQGDMGTDNTSRAIKLWIPQLYENNSAALNRIFHRLSPDEICPIVPFPSADPLRGDRLLRELVSSNIGDWRLDLMNIIYGHESDPNDVYETIRRIHRSRTEVFDRLSNECARTVLSPAGTRIGSIGMLFAAIELNLPVMYAETMGYTSTETMVPSIDMSPPGHAWHIWLRPLTPQQTAT